MATEHTSIQIPPDSELGLELLHAAESGERVRVRVVVGDVTVALDAQVISEAPPVSASQEDDPQLGGIERAAGGWVGHLDFDRFLEDLYERRRTVSRPLVDFDQ